MHLDRVDVSINSPFRTDARARTHTHTSRSRECDKLREHGRVVVAGSKGEYTHRETSRVGRGFIYVAIEWALYVPIGYNADLLWQAGVHAMLR